MTLLSRAPFHPKLEQRNTGTNTNTHTNKNIDTNTQCMRRHDDTPENREIQFNGKYKHDEYDDNDDNDDGDDNQNDDNDDDDDDGNDNEEAQKMTKHWNCLVCLAIPRLLLPLRRCQFVGEIAIVMMMRM